jgi:hypothetical protein
MAAYLALNIAHTFDPQRWPFDAGIGVSIGGGKPIGADDWLGFLERGTLRPMSPLPPTYGQYQPLSPIRGIGGTMTTPVFASELVLANGVAVTAGRLYVIDNKVVVSTVAGTVATLKSVTGGSVVKNCALGARRAYVADLDRIIG